METRTPCGVLVALEWPPQAWFLEGARQAHCEESKCVAGLLSASGDTAGALGCPGCRAFGLRPGPSTLTSWPWAWGIARWCVATLRGVLGSTVAACLAGTPRVVAARAAGGSPAVTCSLSRGIHSLTVAGSELLPPKCSRSDTNSLMKERAHLSWFRAASVVSTGRHQELAPRCIRRAQREAILQGAVNSNPSRLSSDGGPQAGLGKGL